MLFETIPLPESDYLFHQPSQLQNAGEGLFTAIKIFKHEIIAIFHGEELEESEITKRVALHEETYFMNLPNGKILDCKHIDGYAKFANDAEAFHPNIFKNNAIIAMSETNQVCLVAKRTINMNEEIFCGYGKRYWSTQKMKV